MTHRQRALAALRGEPVDRLPFIGRMELWYNDARRRGALPARYAGATLWDIQRDLDIGIYAHVPLGTTFYTLSHRRVEVCEQTRDGERITLYRTPYGELRSRYVLTRDLTIDDVQPIQVEWPFKSPADYDALRFLIDDFVVSDNFDAYARLVGAVGEDGLAMPQTGYVPMHRLAHQFFGYETFFLELHDRPDQVLALCEALTEKYREILRLAAVSPADAIAVGGNYDETLTPPPFFERYITPFYAEARAALAGSGKPLVTHGDGEMRALLRCLRDAGVDGVEAVTPQPMTSIDLRALRALWADRVTLWGGIASVVLTPTYSQAAFEAHLDELFAAVGHGERFILGFGDNVPTDAIFERVEQIARYVREYGAYPLRGTPFAVAR